MASNGSSRLKTFGTTFLILFGLFSIFVVNFANNNPELTGTGLFYEVFFGILAIASFAWAAHRLGLGTGGRSG